MVDELTAEDNNRNEPRIEEIKQLFWNRRMTKKWNTYHPADKELDVEFYEDYDPKFLISKAYVFAGMIRNIEKAKELFEQLEVEIEDKDVDRFNTEIYFAEFQLFEAVFALLLAPFQDESHWVFLTEYTTRHLKEMIEAYLANNITVLTGGKLQTPEEFLDISLFYGFKVEEPKDLWLRNLENIKLIFDRICLKYLRGLEYNAYKHGIRIMTGPSYFRITQTDNPQVGYEWNSDHSVRFLEIDRKKGVLQLSTKQFDPEESMLHMQVMTEMLTTIVSTRLTRWKGLSQAKLLIIPEFDQDFYKQGWAKEFKFSLKVGEKTT